MSRTKRRGARLRGRPPSAALSHVLSRFFEGSPELLMLNLLGRDEPRPQDVERVRDLIRRSQQEKR